MTSSVYVLVLLGFLGSANSQIRGCFIFGRSLCNRGEICVNRHCELDPGPQPGCIKFGRFTCEPGEICVDRHCQPDPGPQPGLQNYPGDLFGTNSGTNAGTNGSPAPGGTTTNGQGEPGPLNVPSWASGIWGQTGQNGLPGSENKPVAAGTTKEEKLREYLNFFKYYKIQYPNGIQGGPIPDAANAAMAPGTPVPSPIQIIPIPGTGPGPVKGSSPSPAPIFGGFVKPPTPPPPPTTTTTTTPAPTTPPPPPSICDRSPCMNNSTCVPDFFDRMSKFECFCVTGLGEWDCSKFLACESEPCMNGGSCDPDRNWRNSGAYKCKCDWDFSGVNCETYIGCHSNPCLNGGSCVNAPDGISYECRCAPGFGDLHCEDIL